MVPGLPRVKLHSDHYKSGYYDQAQPLPSIFWTLDLLCRHSPGLAAILALGTMHCKMSWHDRFRTIGAYLSKNCNFPSLFLRVLDTKLWCDVTRRVSGVRHCDQWSMSEVDRTRLDPLTPHSMKYPGVMPPAPPLPGPGPVSQYQELGDNYHCTNSE